MTTHDNAGAYVIPAREKELRQTLPGLHVGIAPSGVWHVLRANDHNPLCGRTILILEDGPLESASPGRLCRVCARMQGNEYAIW